MKDQRCMRDDKYKGDGSEGGGVKSSLAIFK